MVDHLGEELGEKLRGPETVTARRTKIETASIAMANPDHPGYTADRAVFFKFALDEGALIAVADGTGSGGKDSAKAASIVQEELNKLQTQLICVPTIDHARKLLIGAISRASTRIQELQKDKKNNNVDTTVSVGIVARSEDGSGLVLVTANVGDSSIFLFRPNAGVVYKLTKDDSLVQSLVDAGVISPEEAFLHPERNVVTNTVGSLRGIHFNVFKIQKGDIVLAVTDGVTDNIPPPDLANVIVSKFQAAYDQKKGGPDLKKLVRGIAERAKRIQLLKNIPYAKPDDTTVVAFRVS